MNYDPYYDKVALLIPGFGIDGATYIPDMSPVRKTVNRYGDTKTSAARSKYYGSSAFFDGNGDYLTLDGMPTNADFMSNLSLPFTIEFWLNIAGNNVANVWPIVFTANKNANYRYSIFYNGVVPSLSFTSFVNGTGQYINSGPLSLNQWNHFAIVCEGSALVKIYLNGSLAQSATLTPALSSSDTVSYGIGTGVLFPDAVLGYLQDFRITKGVARYTSNFTPPGPLWCDADTTTSKIITTPRNFYPSDAGLCRIAGYVDELGVVGAYLVRLFDLASGRLVGETWSAANGYYEFKGLAYRPQGYFAVAFDHGADPRNAGIADYISPEFV